MALLTLDDFRAQFETDLSDAALTRLLSAAEAEINRHAGEAGTASDFFRDDTRPRVLVLRRRAVSITSVTERLADTEIALAANDWRLNAGRELVRVWTGANPRTYWAEEVTVAYVPVSDLPIRQRVQADLVKLAAQYQALKQEKVGDLSRTHPEYQAERAAILAGLTSGLVLA